MDKCIVTICFFDGRASEDIVIPLDITALDLMIGLNDAYGLGYDLLRLNEYSLKSENPICLLKGSRKLRDFGLRNGSRIIIA